uniref:Beta-lactamase-related domain-containing protein n=1 Tax=Chromera velia CCMP2878 TaxID=1169474 RepID=A0A0G4HM21_9ALVE|eukprot:Cvel_1155.t1-p1 / transcript=Cvel_1155.t1 / gene=Cvel_1155 / organism=Chromera_velia_CCMP2878 / gene_product=Penicillin-binding protein 4*, putative / transcript_product=Penicillin-binding protein 4*, putative / location=Cvel_scaffold38:81077-83070(-) / protein_length=357 / sequence_SO=supercontig / SO=protein_coding / is_pseudo=false
MSDVEVPAIVRGVVKKLLGKDYEKLPGVSIGIVHEGRTLFSGGFGVADMETQQPLDGRSVFDLASVSKHMTAFALAFAKKKYGGFDLDTPVRKFLSSLPDFVAAGEAERDVLIGDLIFHTSGLPDYTQWESLNLQWTNAELLSHLVEKHEAGDPEAKLDFSTGDTYGYSNLGYALIPLVVQAVSGEDFGTFMQKEVFTPLGMSSTFVPSKSFDKREEGPRGGPGFKHLGFSTDEAEVLWGGKEWKVNGGGEVRDEDGELYGWGWCVKEEEGCMDHSGEWAGTSTFIYRDADCHFSVIVLSNSDWEGEKLSGAADIFQQIYWDVAIELGIEEPDGEHEWASEDGDGSDDEDETKLDTI